MTNLAHVLENEQIETLELELDSRSLNSESSEMDESFDIIEESISALEELTDIGNVINDSVEDKEGLTEDAVKMAEIAIESIFNKLNYKVPVKSVVSLEDYAAITGPSKTEASKSTLQKISDVIKAIFKGIKNFFIRIMEYLTNFWKYLTDSNVRNKKYIDAIKVKIDTLKSNHSTAGDESLNFTQYSVPFNCNNSSHLFTNIGETISAHIYASRNQGLINKELSENLKKIDHNAKIEDVEVMHHLNASYSIEKPMINGIGIIENDKGYLEVKDIGIKKVKNLSTKALHLDELEKITTGIEKLNDDDKKMGDNYRGLMSDIKKGISILDKLSTNPDKKDWEIATYRKAAEILKLNMNVVKVYNFNVPKLNNSLIKLCVEFIHRNFSKYKAA